MALTNDGGWIDANGLMRFRGFSVMSVDGRHCGFGARLVEADIDANIRQTLAGGMRQVDERARWKKLKGKTNVES